jgi:hypothetical protein
MILIISTFVTNNRSGYCVYNAGKMNYSRIDIFKYMIKSYKTLPFTEIYLFIKLDNEFILFTDDIINYIYGTFSNLNKDKIHIVMDRYTSQDKWILFFEHLMNQYDHNQSVWFSQNDDHIYVDYNTDILLEGLKHLESDHNRHKSIMLSHWPEAIKLSGKHNNQIIVVNYVKFDLSILDSIQIFNLQFLYDIFVLHKWKQDHIRIDSLLCDFMNGSRISFENPLSQVIYVPLREMVRHFDGYGHVNLDESGCPRLELPMNTFYYTKDILLRKMTPYHKSQWTMDNNFIIPQEWIDINLSLHAISEYTV